MKTTKLALGLALGLWGGVALGQSETNIAFNVNAAIPDGNVFGLTLATNLTVAPVGWGISGVTVSVDISGGCNGDYYGFLRGPNGGFAVLLNRVGVSNDASAFGYSDAGLNVTFSDGAANSIQYYQSVAGYSLNGTAWQPEGVTVDPLTNNPAAFWGAPQSAMLGSFDGTAPNGTWTLFLADVVSGNEGTVVSWGLDIATVPEPGSLALVGLGLAAATLLVIRRRKL